MGGEYIGMRYLWVLLVSSLDSRFGYSASAKCISGSGPVSSTLRIDGTVYMDSRLRVAQRRALKFALLG